MQLYIDPGTGSMLFTILIGVVGVGVYALRNLAIKARFLLSGGRARAEQTDRIPYVIFTDSKRYWNVFAPICREFENRKTELLYLTASPDDPALKESFQYVKCQFAGEGNRAFTKLNLLKADVLLSSTPGLDVYQWKRSRDVKWYVHVLHAANDVTAYRMFGLDYYDGVLLSGAYQIRQLRQLEKLRNLPPKELPLIGQPYMDEMKKRLESTPAPGPHPTTVLLAPSWGINSIFNRYGGDMIRALLDTGCHVIVRPHPQSRTSEKEMLQKLMRDFPESSQLEWNMDNDNFQVLNRSDILISDFSGVIFDFALVFDKPVIYADTSFDTAPLDACWLEEPMWTFSILPRIGRQLTRENMPRIRELIDSCLQDSCYAEGRQQARQETWVNRGESARRTAEYMIAKRAELLEEKIQAEPAHVG